MVPSSPLGPCRIGSTTVGGCAAVGATSAPSRSVLGPSISMLAGSSCARPPASSSAAADAWRQSPSRVMPTGTTS